MRKLTKEDIFKSSSPCLTVGRLLEFIKENEIPMDAPVMIQRVEDKYYENNGWGVYLKKGENYYYAEQWNQNMTDEIDRRIKGEEPNFPRIENPVEKMHDLEAEEFDLMEQYHPAWSGVGYKDDTNMLFIDLHF